MCCVLFRYDRDEEEEDKDSNLKEEKDVDSEKLVDEDSWGGNRGYQRSARDGRQAPIPTFRAYSSEEFKQRDRKCITTFVLDWDFGCV